MPRQGNTRKKTRTHVVEDEDAPNALSSNEGLKVPRSAVVHRGKIEADVYPLIMELRRMLLPYTALHLKSDPKSKLSDYSKSLTGPMGLTHLLCLSQNQSRLMLRMCRTPAGPTLNFNVKSFSLVKHIRASQRRPYDSEAAYGHAPIVVTNDFGGDDAPPHVKLMRITFQNLFPAVNIAKVKLTDCRRVVLFHLLKKDEQDENAEDEEVEMRHYAIRAKPVGVDRKVRRIVQAKIPNLGKLNDISDYILGKGYVSSGDVSDSEPEDEANEVVLPQKFAGKGNSKSQKSALKLVELGPRLRLKLAKVERDLGSGDVMYHAYVSKTKEEVSEQKKKLEGVELLKKRRREQQDVNVQRKKSIADEKKETKKRRREANEKQIMEGLRGTMNEEDVEISTSEESGEESGEESASESEEE